MGKDVYIKCPRCELNFTTKKDKFCPVCKQEMQALSTNYTDDRSTLGMCPICKVNYVTDEETVCGTCMDESNLSGEEIDALYGGIALEKDGSDEEDDMDDDEDDMEIINLDMDEEDDMDDDLNLDTEEDDPLDDDEIDESEEI